MGCNLSAILKADFKSTQTSSNMNKFHRDMFVIQGLIGEGGFGKVLMATCRNDYSKWLAIKEIDKNHLLKHKSGVAMLFSELNALKRVDHPFIISLYIAFHDKKNCYLVMDLKTGGDLRYYLRKRKNFEEVDVVFYIACISSALNHIHSKNMIHRDIKPENIILDERGYPHLADFGVAHVQSTKGADYLASTLASGTKQYLAPEVFCNSHIHGPESDFWSLGVVAYELLFSHRPFDKHCSSKFITYLEGCIGLKKKQMKYGSNPSTNSTLLSTPEYNHVMNHSGPDPYSIASGQPAVTGLNDSPMNPMRSNIPHPPIASHHHSSSTGLQHHKNITSGSLTNESHTGVSHIFPSGSYSQQHNSIHSFCSSVGYTVLHTANDTLNTFKCDGKNIHKTFDNNVVEDTQPLDKSTEPGTTEESLPKLGKVPSHQQHHHIFDKVKNDSKKPMDVLAKGICCIEESMYSITFDENSDKSSDIRFPNIHTNQSIIQEKVIVTTIPDDLYYNEVSLPAGDHWLVKDSENLPKELRVSIPHWNIVEEKLSNECIRFMRNILDIRPCHRLSSRDINKIENHPWLTNYGLNNWEELLNKKMKPNFRPGKIFLIDTFGDLSQEISLAGNNYASYKDSNTMMVDRKYDDKNDIDNKSMDTSFKGFEFISSLYADINKE